MKNKKLGVVVIVVLVALIAWGVLGALGYAPSIRGMIANAEVQEVQVVKLYDGITTEDACTVNSVLCEYMEYKTMDHEVNRAPFIETRNSFAGEIGE